MWRVCKTLDHVVISSVGMLTKKHIVIKRRYRSSKHGTIYINDRKSNCRNNQHKLHGKTPGRINDEVKQQDDCKMYDQHR